MKIELLSLNDVYVMLGKLDPKITNHSWISITGSDYHSPLPDKPNILKVKFDDIYAQYYPRMMLFDAKIAERIIDFAEGISGNHLIIHCFAGISRSGAVGEVLNSYLNQDLTVNQLDYDRFIKKYGKKIYPNRMVKNILLQTLRERQTQRDFNHENG
jgi:predicted protein tyrosine phosphatase